MTWPLDSSIRPYIRIASYWLGEGWDAQQIINWARESRHFYNLASMEEALHEAMRANYFAEFIRDRGTDTPFGTLWFAAARGAWYAGYGARPTTEQQAWAYTRPQDQLGLMIEVTGRGARTGEEHRYTITVNASWNSTMRDVLDYVRDCVANGSCITGELGSEPLDEGSIEVGMIGGALVARQAPTLTVY